jgi:hypothetical protein
MVGSLPHGLDKAHVEQHGTIERLWSHLAIKKYSLLWISSSEIHPKVDCEADWTKTLKKMTHAVRLKIILSGPFKKGMLEMELVSVSNHRMWLNAEKYFI